MNKNLDTVLYILGLVLVGLFLLGISLGHCANPLGNVKDNNNGNQGYIFIHSGQRQGNDDIGNWTDIATIPELKGGKGDTGAAGARGDQGVTGKDGLNGLNGIDGAQGIHGDKGDTGAAGKDVDPATVTNIQNDINNVENLVNIEVDNRVITDNNLQSKINTEYLQRVNSDNQLNNRINDTNSRVDNLDNRVHKLERTQYKLQAEFRIWDTKHFTVSPYISNNFTRNKIDEVGIRVTVKLGTSYEEREIAKTNKRLERLETYLNQPEVEEAIQQVRMDKIKVGTDGKSFWIRKEF